MIFIEGCSEKAPDFNEESKYTFQKDISKDDTNKQPQDATQDNNLTYGYLMRIIL